MITRTQNIKYFIFLLSLCCAKKEHVIPYWSVSYGGEGRDYGRDLIEVRDGYVGVGGYGYDGESFRSHFLIFGVDRNGDLEWNKIYKFGIVAGATRIIKTDDGYGIAGAAGTDPQTNLDGLFVKMDEDFNVKWAKAYGYGEENEEEIYSVCPAENGYILTGVTHQKYGGDVPGDMWVLKIDRDGEILWEKRFGSNNEEIGIKVISPSKGRYILIGRYEGEERIDGTAFLIFNEKGEFINTKIFANESSYRSLDTVEIVITPDGEVLMGGYPTFVLKTTQNGEIRWSKHFYVPSDEYALLYINHIIITEDGYLLTGWGARGVLLIKIDRGGNVKWCKKMDKLCPFLDCFVIAAKSTSDGGIIMIGEADDEKYYYEVWMVRIPTDLNIPELENCEVLSAEMEVSAAEFNIPERSVSAAVRTLSPKLISSPFVLSSRKEGGE